MWKRRLFWALWLIAAALLWLFENNAATLSLLAASVLLPIISVLSAVRRGKKARLTLSVAQVTAKSSTLPIKIAAEGVGAFSRIAGYILQTNGLTREQSETVLSFAPGLSRRASVAIQANTAHCGALRIHAQAWTEDLFGLWRSAALSCEDEFVMIEPALFLPRVSLTENTTVITDGELYSQTKPGSDPSETFGIREYYPGDPIRQIHWKLSQKSVSLLLRELGLPVVNRTLLVFRNVLAEHEAVSPELADAMAEVFLSVSHALVCDGLAHTAAYSEHGQYALTEVQNETDYHSMLSRFLTLSWEPDDGALERLLAETPYAHVAVVSASVPSDAERFCRGNRVTVLTVSEGTEASGVYTVLFSSEGYENELQYLEL